LGRRLLVVAVVVVVLTASGVWWFFLRDDAPPPATLHACGDTGQAVDAEGTWEVVAGDDVFVGYRIDEKFGGDTLSRTVVGRTPDVTGSMRVEGDRVTEATFEADLASLASDEPRRDAYLGDHALEIADHPTATFTLTEPISLPDVGVGDGVEVDAVGTLELHGTTLDVTIPLDACLTDAAGVQVAGSLPVVLADYGIETPDIPGLVRVEEQGELELQLDLTIS
jgi:polyisoprenoid-binding protein YceI